MTRRVALPTEAEVRAELAQISATEPNGAPTVIALARSLGLANATFWRHFPEIAQEVAATRRSAKSVPTAGGSAGNGPSGNDRAEMARLRREKSKLREQLEAAVAHIQHLTLEHQALREDNGALREALELARNVAQLPRR